MNEVGYYPQLAKCLESATRANLSSSAINVKAMYLPEYGSNIRAFLAKYLSSEGVGASNALRVYSKDVPKLRTDIVVLLDNPSRNKFEIVVVEAKLLGAAGLTELSQLIGYCLVTRAAYGLLININGGVSNELATILNSDLDLAQIPRRLVHDPYEITHKIGVMSYSSETSNLSYIPTSALQSLPQVVQEIEQNLI